MGLLPLDRYPVRLPLHTPLTYFLRMQRVLHLTYALGRTALVASDRAFTECKDCLTTSLRTYASRGLVMSAKA